MRNNVGKRVLAYLCVLSLCLAYLPAFSNTVTANAADAENAAASADVTVTMVDKGEIAVGKDENKTLMAEVPVHAVDLNADGKIDIDETFKAMHETYCPGGFESSVGQYGLSVDKLWGDTSGSFGYYVNNNSAWSLADEVKTGDSVKGFIYKDGIKWSDQYSWFDVNKCNAAVGKEVTLSLKAYEFDENYNPVEKAYAGATLGTVSADGTFTAFSNAVTDKDGKAAISFDKDGTYVVSAKAQEGASALVSPVCIVTIASADVTVTMVDKGNIAVGKDENKTLMAEVPVHAVDLNADGKIDIDETFKAMHETYCPGGFETGSGTYGAYITKIWGVETSNCGYFVNDESAGGLTQEVKTGDFITACVYDNEYDYDLSVSDYYTWFNVNKCDVQSGKSITLNLKKYDGYDENWNTIVKPYEGAVLGTVAADGTFTAFSNVVTDANGNATISFDKAGTYVVSAKAPEGARTIVSPVCIVTVTPAPVIPESTPNQKPGKDTDKTTEEAPAITITLTIKKDTETATTEAKTTEAAQPSSAQKTVKKTTAKVASVTSAKKKQAAVQLKKVKKATGYQVQLSTSKKFTKKTTVTVNTKKVKYTFKKLKSGKTYYVRSRAYRKENKTTVYGKYSRIAKIVVK